LGQVPLFVGIKETMLRVSAPESMSGEVRVVSFLQSCLVANTFQFR
jgi:hypothetical protein